MTDSWIRWLGCGALAALLVVAAPAPSNAAGCRFPGARTICPAPAGRAAIVWQAADDTGARKHALLLRRPEQPDQPLREFDRFVEVFWSPDTRAVAVTDHYASGESTVWMLRGRDLTAQVDLGAEFDPDPSKHGPRRLVVDRWLDDDTLALIETERNTHPPRVVAKITYNHGRTTSDAHLRMTAGVIGLLELPEIFGRMQMCEPTVPATVSIYDRPSSGAVTGVIRVMRVAAPETSGCREELVGLVIAGRETNLPTHEYAYEAPGVIVHERRAGWFRIQLPTGSGWVRAAAGRTFHPIEELVTDHLAYLTAHSGPLYTEAGGRVTRPRPPLEPGDTVDVQRVMRVKGRLWALVEKLHPCDAATDPEPGTPVVRGWVPLYDAEQHPTIWFFSRGC